MAHDEALADRLRDLLADRVGIEERRMFGGLAFLLDGALCAGVLGEELVARVAAEETAAVLELPHVRPFDFTGRPMRGFVFVAAEGCAMDGDLAAWVERGLRVATSRKGSAAPKRGARRRR